MNKGSFSKNIVNWYLNNKRKMPWRDTGNPYFVWLSEIILQQTRVSQGTPYYLKFVEAFPTVKDLANAEEQEVLRLWQGLGYYSRARNLHKGAKMIMSNFGGKVPSNYKDLLTISGVGPYTAAAVASIVAKEPVAVVDGNVFRVLSRVFGVYDDIASTKGTKRFLELANELVSKKDPDLHNQGVMEFGSLHCTPQTPDCDNCMFMKSCFAFANHAQKSLPVKIKKLKIKKRYFHYLVLKKKDRLMMKKREGKGIWQGLYDFKLIEYEEFLDIERLMKAGKIPAKAIVDEAASEHKHLLSHQEIHARFYDIELPIDHPVKEEVSAYSIAEVQDLPKPILVEKYLKGKGYY